MNATTTITETSSPRADIQQDFHEAVRKGDQSEWTRLLRGCSCTGVNVNVFDGEGQTPLHQSVLDGNLELVKLLVKFGADVRLANRDGWSALHIASYGGHEDIVLYLIQRKPNYLNRHLIDVDDIDIAR